MLENFVLECTLVLRSAGFELNTFGILNLILPLDHNHSMNKTNHNDI